METTDKTNERPILKRIAEQLLKDQQELDELAVQFALGKAEVMDKFEETKKFLRKSVLEYKEILSSDFKQNKEWAGFLKLKLDDLEEQLAKGKTESKEMFEQQKQAILKSIVDLKNEVKKNPEAHKVSDYFIAAYEKAELQLALFEKKIGDTKKELTKEFKDEMHTAGVKINSILDRLKDKRDDVDEKMENFKDEIRLSYSHLKKAIRSL